MTTRSLKSRRALWLIGLTFSLTGLLPAWLHAQAPSQGPEGRTSLKLPAAPPSQAVVYNVQAPTQRLEMIVNSSRILTLERPIPQAQVGNRELLDLTPLSATQVQVFAKRPGVTQINLWDDQNQIRAIDVVIFGDARELQQVLSSQFPRSSLKVTPLANSVVVSGYVDRPDHVSRIIQMAQDYHPQIINNITVGGVQQVLLDVKVMEVTRTDLRTLGIDLAHFSGNDFAVSSVSGLITGLTSVPITGALPVTPTETFTIGVTNPNSSFFAVIEALRQKNLAKIISSPKIVTVSGRPARFLQGGQFPILVPQSLGTVSVEYRPYGTEVDFVPIVMGNGIIRLELRPRVSEIDPGLSVFINGINVPAMTIREVDTAVEMRAGQTLAIAGLVQQRTQVTSRALPWFGELPYVGALFRRNSSQKNEVETLIMVTPQLVEAMDPHQVPRCGPGMNTDLPSDWELFMKGYIEVPRCCPPQGQGPGGSGMPPVSGLPYRSVGPEGVEEVQPPANLPPSNRFPAAPAPPNGALPPPTVVPPPVLKPPGANASGSPPGANASGSPSGQNSTSNSRSGNSTSSLPAVSRAPAPAMHRSTSAVPAAPAPSGNRNTGTNPVNRQDRNNPPEPTARRVQAQVISGPGFIGPTGYDDVK